MSKRAKALHLVFTDLDGSLLDHNSYSYRDAQPQLRVLEKRGIPLIPVSSKTPAEIEALRHRLDNHHPYIAENGAAVFIPRDYFPQQPEATKSSGEFWVYAMSKPRAHWLQLLREQEQEFAGEFDYFFRAGTAGISRMTKLPAAEAELANQRGYSEPVLWLGTADRREKFASALRQAGASVQQGGRFLAVGGDCDKGRALSWLRETYLEYLDASTCEDLAIGDSRNDVAMLEVATSALVVRSPAHEYPTLTRRDRVLYSKDYGPAGWAEGVALWLSQLQSG